MPGKLDTYQRKRRFDATPEPSGSTGKPATKKAAARKAAAKKAPARSKALSFVIQEHDARRLHYDFRLELDGTLRSWAVPKGPSLDPSVKRLAVHVEDHPLDYGSFEGEIPEGNYGAGSVIVWDRGTWEPQSGTIREAIESYEKGKLKFRLDGEKLHGGWTLVRSHMRGNGDKEQWLLIKERDEDARAEADYDILLKKPGSVLTDSLGARNRKGEIIGRTERKAPARKSASKASKKPTKEDRPDIVANRNAESLRTLAHEPSVEGAVKTKLPATLKPQLATLVDAAPPGGNWSYEIKFDGYRVLARIDRSASSGGVQVWTRNGNDWTAKFSRQVTALEQLEIDSGWLDGEAVVLDDRGLPDFQALQNAFDAGRPQDIVVYWFDVPFLNGYDLRQVPLVQRRAILKALIEPVDDPALRFSDDFAFKPDDLLKSACDMALEGIIGKRIDSTYVSGRSSAWIKLKCRRRQEFVIGGYSEPSGSRGHFGALLLGVHDSQGKLQYAGRVGSGFDQSMLRDIKKELDKRETGKMPFAREPVERSRTRVHWVKPELVAECNFAEWTKERIVRQASFVSLRNDKPARQIVREEPKPAGQVEAQAAEETAKPARKAAVKKTAVKKAAAKKASSSKDASLVAGVKISHPERVIDKSAGIRKIDVVNYYESVADWMLPHLRDRPVSLVRAPEDIGGELFFQKHSARLAIPHITQHEGIDPGHPPLLTIESAGALVGTAQMGTVELHTWNALASSIEKPDRMVFDLDPGEGVGWERMTEAARLTRELLEELGLEAFCKTSGGKGLHVVVPIAKQAGWDEVKGFSQAVAQHMANTLPKLFSAKMGMQNRKGKIFIDYLRNNRGSSTVAAFSLRARPGMGASVTIDWNELDDVKSGDQWNIGNVRERLDSLRADPWAGYGKKRQRPTVAMKKRLGIESE
ncbi:DNA ligase D [Caballeronia arationis]|jgi:bifunctional non-homologous end joining protein LigD|uniref:DNA ligase (ATP) n=1 Tax=Caballeronia arationis TaxID=1777142 RepID=A0A7Z7N573_9BURK|nr:DNA ligase D [Caballeronia arationis]SAK87778.1 DNA ligase D [Caballeronia arationis]SOE81852.1 bifunctional non-homologous end joining protein LigD [Caballeronia arationis]